MTSQTLNDLSHISNNNVIKIPYSDNQEESLIDTSLHINGFTVIELDEEKKDYSYLIPSYEEELNIGKKQKIQLESKARNVENYYSFYQDGAVPNVNCSKCLLSNFASNELLYFKDRKTLVLYLKYCFLYLKKNIFMNHLLYMKNKYELSKINQSFYSGWKFSIPKTICKACFIQIINTEFLINNIKNIICDYDETNISNSSSQKKVPTLINNKRKRVISKNKRKQISIKKDNIYLEDKINDITSQFTPIVISISENEKIKKKKRRSTSTVFKRRKQKNVKKSIKKRYNENIIYDDKNSLLIINKRGIGNYQIDEDSSIINKIINDNKKTNINKDKENSKQINQKDEKMKFVSSNKNESDSLTNKKTAKKEKKSENNENKDKNGNMNKIYTNKGSIPKNIDNKNTIIINNFNNNNKSDEINMNKVGLIQINNNQFDNNNFNNYSNNDFNIKNNLNQNNNNNNILINNLNNNNNYNNYFNYSYISIIQQLFINPNRINQDIFKLQSCLNSLIYFTSMIRQNIVNNNIGNINQYLNNLFIYIAKLNETLSSFNDTKSAMDYSLNIMKYNIMIFKNNFNEYNNYSNYIELYNIVSYLDEKAKIIKNNYDNLFIKTMEICKLLRQIIETIVKI